METCSIPISPTFSSEMKGSYAMTFILRPLARSATILPILPNPIIPRILSESSLPMNFFFSHFPAFKEAVAWGMFLDKASIIEMACSAVVVMLPSGAFITTIPLFVAAFMSTLSNPIPALPITRRFSAASIISAVTFVALLIAIP